MPTDPLLTAQVHEQMPFVSILGVEMHGATAEHVCARVPWRPERCTSGETMHGAVFMGLADISGGLLAFMNLPDGSAGTTTIESKTNFLRAVRDGGVTCIATPLHRGRTTFVAVGDLHDDAGLLVGRVTQTQAFLWPSTEDGRLMLGRYPAASTRP